MEKWCFVKVAQLTLLSQSIRDFSHSAGQGLTKWLIYYCMSAGGLGTSHCIEWGYPFFPQSNRAYWCQAYLSSWSTPLLLDHFVFLPPSAFHFHQSTVLSLQVMASPLDWELFCPKALLSLTVCLLIVRRQHEWVIFSSLFRVCVCVFVQGVRCCCVGVMLALYTLCRWMHQV